MIRNFTEHLFIKVEGQDQVRGCYALISDSLVAHAGATGSEMDREISFRLSPGNIETRITIYGSLCKDPSHWILLCGIVDLAGQ